MPQNLESNSPSDMEVKSSFGQTLLKQEVGSLPVDSPHLPCSDSNESSNMEINPSVPDNNLQHNLMQLQKQHEIQREFLLRQYQQQQQQLAEHQEKQMQRHIQYLEQQTQKAEEERAQKQRHEQERIEAIKMKDKHEHSAVASSEVKQRLQDMILKKQRENIQGQSPAGGPSSIRNWGPGHILHDEYPLRKTASEPNICLRQRLKKHRLVERERKTSPLVTRKDRVPAVTRRRQMTRVDSASTPDSGQESPPNGIPPSRSSSGSTPIHEEGSGSPYGITGPIEQCPDLSHPFTSLPNISLGRPPHSSQPDGLKLPIVSETEMVNAAKAGMPLTGHILPSTLPNYPTLPVLESDMSNRHTAMDTSGTIPSAIVGTMYTTGSSGPPLSEVQQARLRTLQRPLGRTQSSPLPLGHPMLQGPSSSAFIAQAHGMSSTTHHFDHKLDHHPHSIIKQHIRQAVLKRSGSKSQVENVEEETEADVAQAIGKDRCPEDSVVEALQEDESEVIDLTEKKLVPSFSTNHLLGDTSYPPERGPLLFYNQRELSTSKPTILSGISGARPLPRSGSHIARPLTRAQSSPSVTLPPTGSPQETFIVNKYGATTGIAYESLMQKHQCVCGIAGYHPEHGGRIHSIWNRLQDVGLTARCHRLRPRKANIEELKSAHSEAHTLFFGSNPISRQQVDFGKYGNDTIKKFVRLQCGGIGIDSDTTWNDMHTASAARMAVGCCMELAFKASAGDLKNGFAIVRPPGHHAEYQQAMGFCFFNTVAITAKQLQQKLGLEKILIVDWDVHHGNGTQSISYGDPHTLYISIHRYDDGSFFPGTGSITEVGEGDGYGFNVNIAWSGGLNPPIGDAEYLAAFRSIVMPIARDYDPDIVLVSAGFDAANGHPPPLGGYKVSAACFAHMTKDLMCLAKGKVVMALEGGYDIDAICDASQACLQALLGDNIPEISEQELSRRPCINAVETLQNVVAVQTIHWPVVRQSSGLIGLSANEVYGKEEMDTVSAMASLRVDHNSSHNPSPEPVIQTSQNDEDEPMEEDMDTK